MREDHHGPAGGLAAEIGRQPLQLVRAEVSEAFQHSGVIQADEMHVLMIEAVPSAALGAEGFAVAVQILPAVIDGSIVLAGHVVDLSGFGAAQHLVQDVELPGLGIVAQIAGVDDEIGLVRESIDFIDGGLKRSRDVRIGRFAEADVAVADLHEVKFSPGAFRVAAEGLGTEDAAADGPQDARAGPGHAFQETAAVDAVGRGIVNGLFCQMGLPLAVQDRGGAYFIPGKQNVRCVTRVGSDPRPCRNFS